MGKGRKDKATTSTSVFFSRQSFLAQLPSRSLNIINKLLKEKSYELAVGSINALLEHAMQQTNQREYFASNSTLLKLKTILEQHDESFSSQPSWQQIKNVLCFFIGINFTELEQFLQAKPYMEQTLDNFKPEYQIPCSRILFQLGVIQKHLHNYNEALKYFSSAQQHYLDEAKINQDGEKTDADDHAQAALDLNISQCKIQLNQNVEALDFLAKAKKFFQKNSQHALSLALVNIDMGIAYCNTSQYSEALKPLTEAKAFFNQNKKEDSQSLKICKSLALSFYYLNRYEEAAVNLLEARQKYINPSEDKDKMESIFINIGLGMCCFAQNDILKASNFLTKVLSFYDEELEIEEPESLRDFYRILDNWMKNIPKNSISVYGPLSRLSTILEKWKSLISSTEKHTLNELVREEEETFDCHPSRI